MRNLTDKLKDIKIQAEVENAKFEQLSKFEHTLNDLQKVLTLDKPTYSLPHVDTIGKRTYSSLNKK
ncbi:MAG: hypothetical protein JNL17_08410 [Cyclobacteriaceae bacterium]|nr:hypothetical protein [Cyclobacteriaceae bacterium]